MGKNEVGKIFITLYCGISILSNLNGKFIPSDFITSRFFQLLFPTKCIPSFLNTPRPTVTITWPVLSSHVLLNVIFMNNMNFRRNKLEWFKLDGVLLIRLIRYPVKFNKNFSLNHWIHHVSNWTVIPRQCSRTFHHLDSKTFSSNSSETHSGSF